MCFSCARGMGVLNDAISRLVVLSLLCDSCFVDTYTH